MSRTDDSFARPYHHGDLRRTLLQVAAREIEREGAAALSLRALARSAGVSHAAPAHHFGDKAGLLTALAAEGYQLMTAQLTAAMNSSDRPFLESAVAYVRFALTHPAHFAVMFRPDLLRTDDAELNAARAANYDLLQGGSATVADDSAAASAAVAAWSLVHGLATLHLTGNLEPEADLARIEDLTRSAATQIFTRGPRR